MTLKVKRKSYWTIEWNSEDHIVEYDYPINDYYWLIINKDDPESKTVEVQYGHWTEHFIKQNGGSLDLARIAKYLFHGISPTDLIVEKIPVNKEQCIIYYVWDYEEGDPPGSSNGYWVAFNTQNDADLWWYHSWIDQGRERALFPLTNF